MSGISPNGLRFYEMSLGELVLSMDADFCRRQEENDWLEEPVWITESRRMAEEARARRRKASR